MNLKDPLTLSIIGGIISMIALFINDKISKKKTENVDFVKIFFLVFIITYGIQINSVTNIKSGGGTKIHIGNPTF